MNKRQFQNMLRRREAAKAPPVAPPTPLTEFQQRRLDLAAAKAKDDEAALLEAKQLVASIEQMGGWHLFWRAGRLLDRVDGKPKRPNHPKNDNGGFVSMRTLLKLPNDPHRNMVESSIDVVPNYVKSLPNKGNVPIMKLVGFTEVSHATHMKMHFKVFDGVEPRELVRWLLKFGALVKSGQLKRNILRMESIYGTPRIIQDFKTGPAGVYPESKGRVKVPSQVAKHGPMAKRGNGAALHMAKVRARLNKERIHTMKGARPFRQNMRIVHQQFAFDVYRKPE